MWYVSVMADLTSATSLPSAMHRRDVARNMGKDAEPLCTSSKARLTPGPYDHLAASPKGHHRQRFNHTSSPAIIAVSSTSSQGTAILQRDAGGIGEMLRAGSGLSWRRLYRDGAGVSRGASASLGKADGKASLGRQLWQSTRMYVGRGRADLDPYPWAIEEGFDAYRTLMETAGRVIGIKSGKLGVVLTGDSA